MKIARIAGLTASACIAAFAVGWAIFTGVAWLGYSRLGADRNPDPALDRFMPVYEVAERHETLVSAPASIVFAAATTFSLEQSPLVRAIFRGREVLLRASSKNRVPPNQSLLEETKKLGWGMLAEEPGRCIVMGAVTQPWQPNVIFQALPPPEFASFNKPGYVKIVWTIEVKPVTPSTSIFRTVTRVQTTDAVARGKFRRYWALFSPGIWIIRKESLRIVRADAERRFRRSP